MYALGTTPRFPRESLRFPRESARFPRESSPPDPRLRRHGCFSALTPGDRPRSAASALYALTSLSRSIAARANPLILSLFSSPVADFSPCSPVSTAEPLFLHTRHSSLYVVPCLRPVALPCAGRAPHPLNPLGKGDTSLVLGACYKRNTCRDFNGLEDDQPVGRSHSQRRSASVSPTGNPRGNAR